MKSVLCVVATASAMAIASGAQAAPADLGSYAGLHVEGQGGWDHANTKLKYDDGVFKDEAKDSRDGVTYGFAVGYDVDFGGVLLGTEGALDWSTEKDCGTSDGVRSCVKAGRSIEAGVRVGTQLGATGPLVYAKLAYVNARLNASVSDIDGSLTGHHDLDGVRVGVGLEQKLTRRVYMKAEYRYTKFKDFDLSDVEKAQFDRHQVIGGVGMLF